MLLEVRRIGLWNKYFEPNVKAILSDVTNVKINSQGQLGMLWDMYEMLTVVGWGCGCFNTLKARQSGRHFANGGLGLIFWYTIYMYIWYTVVTTASRTIAAKSICLYCCTVFNNFDMVACKHTSLTDINCEWRRHFYRLILRLMKGHLTINSIQARNLFEKQCSYSCVLS